MAEKESVEKTIHNTRRNTRKKYSAEDKIRFVLEDLRGETTNAELRRREGIHSNMYYCWSDELSLVERWVGFGKCFFSNMLPPLDQNF